MIWRVLQLAGRFVCTTCGFDSLAYKDQGGASCCTLPQACIEQAVLRLTVHQARIAGAVLGSVLHLFLLTRMSCKVVDSPAAVDSKTSMSHR